MSSWPNCTRYQFARATPPPIPPPAVDARAEKARRARAKKKRVAIAVEALASDASITKVPKDKASTKLILNAVERNILFDGLNEETRLVLASTMTRAVAAAAAAVTLAPPATHRPRAVAAIS
mgnify:CR=1 FL=1